MADSNDDDDAELVPLADYQERLSWRLDPDISYSDWTIEILQETGGGGEDNESKAMSTYNVHKNILSVGAKKSDYFTALFRSTMNPEEARTKTSRITELNKLAADAFPDFLDYMYALDDELKITHENSAALYELGQYFGCSRLRKKVVIFWKNDFPLEKCGMYYEHFKILSNEKLVLFIVKGCCESLKSAEWDESLSKSFDSYIWMEILKEFDGEPNEYLSVHLADYCYQNKDTIDAETFSKLTDEKLLPLIAPKPALLLMEVENAVLPENCVGKLSKLQKRCIQKLVEARYCGRKDDLAKFSPLVLSSFLVKTMEQARSDHKQYNEAVPKEVVVTGAGEAVDGTYRRVSKSIYKAPQFVMERSSYGATNQRYVQIYLSTAVNRPATNLYWYITECNAAGDSFLISSDSSRYYVTHQHITQEDSLRLPPQSGWLQSAAGEGTPSLSFVYEN